MRRLTELLGLLTVLIRSESAQPCHQNEDCSTNCCLFARGHVGKLRGTCHHFVDIGEYCIPGNTERRFLNKYVYISSCPCIPPLECLPEYTYFKDQITAFINPTCQIPPTEPTTPTPPTTPTLPTTPSTTPCPTRGTFQLNLSISVPFDQKDQIHISAFGNKV